MSPTELEEGYIFSYGSVEYDTRTLPLLPVTFIPKLIKVKPKRCYFALECFRYDIQTKKGWNRILLVKAKE